MTGIIYNIIEIIANHLVLFLIFYHLYFSFGQMILAKRMGLSHAWFAFIPILDTYLLAKMAGQSFWPIIGNRLLSFVPFVGFIFSFIYGVQILFCWYVVFLYFEKKWYWLLLYFIPIVNFFALGVLIYQTANYSHNVDSSEKVDKA